MYLCSANYENKCLILSEILQSLNIRVPTNIVDPNMHVLTSKSKTKPVLSFLTLKLIISSLCHFSIEMYFQHETLVQKRNQAHPVIPPEHSQCYLQRDCLLPL
jgi:hypothetical protein